MTVLIILLGVSALLALFLAALLNDGQDYGTRYIPE